VRDDGEFVAFVERSGSRLCETAFLLCRDWNFAQDLTQITFIKVYLSWRRIRNDDPYRYSKKVLLRAYLDHKRLKSSAELRTDAVPDRAAVADAAELRLTLLDALGQLSPRDRAIIVLRYWEDHSIQTVSELLDLSPGVVKVQSMRALARLRVLLGEDEAPQSLPPQPGARYAVPRPPEARSRL
jgi:RNA polymerase sigma-70 factor (sigma-E family)